MGQDLCSKSPISVVFTTKSIINQTKKKGVFKIMSDGYELKRTPNILRYNEKVSKTVDNVSSIKVEEASADVNVTITEAKDILVHLHGTIDIDGSVDFDSDIQDDGTLLVNLKATGGIHKNNLVLDIFIPIYKALDTIFIKSNKNISIDSGIFVKDINVLSISGNALVYADFINASINADTIDINIFAEQNISLDVTTKYGDVTVNLSNVANVNYTNLDDKTSLGKVTSKYKVTSGGVVTDLRYSLGTGKMIVC